MIDYLVTGEFSQIQSRVYIILAMWVVMVMAVCMDLWAGWIVPGPGERKLIRAVSGGRSGNWGIIGGFR